MQARLEDVSALLKLQQADLDGLHARKKLEALPQRVKIAELRAKKNQVADKKAQVDELHATAEGEVAAIESEDAKLAEKQRSVQAEIDEVRGDYRSVETRTKELNGISKRRVTLEEQLGVASEKLAKIEALQTQVASALEKLNREEAAEVASYREEGGGLQRAMAEAEAQHEKIVAGLPADLVSLYDKTAARCGGVAIGVLNGTKCGVCRSEIPHERLIEIRKSAPLSTCPACHRLLVVTEAGE